MCTRFVVFDWERQFAQTDPWLPVVKQNSYTKFLLKVTLTNLLQWSWCI